MENLTSANLTIRDSVLLNIEWPSAQNSLNDVKMTVDHIDEELSLLCT